MFGFLFLFVFLILFLIGHTHARTVAGTVPETVGESREGGTEIAAESRRLGQVERHGPQDIGDRAGSSNMLNGTFQRLENKRQFRPVVAYGRGVS